MTTAVYRDGVLAADSVVFDRDCYCGDVVKVRKSGLYLMTAAGSLACVLKFFEWVERGRPETKDDRPRLSSDFEGLCVNSCGDIMWYGEDLIGQPIKSPYIAIGSGFKIAMGALAMGATAQQAVEVCCDLDAYTRRPVVACSIKDLPR